MSDAGWHFLAAVPFALALWDVGRRAVEHISVENETQRKAFTEALGQHEEKYKTALQNVVKQVRDEVDSISAEIAENVNWTRSKFNDQNTKVAPWQQAHIDRRNQDRKKASRVT